MTFSTEELQKLRDYVLFPTTSDLATELLAARAKLEAAEKLAEAVRHEIARSRRHLAAVTFSALAEWGAH